MANSIDDIISKSSPEQQERFKQVAKDFKEHVTSDNKVENAAQATRPQTPSQTQPNPTDLDKVQPNAQTMDRIKGIEQGKGNNYQNDNKPQNAVDKTLSAQSRADAKEAGQNLNKQGVTSNDKER
jgi:hypothetical protein